MHSIISISGQSSHCVLYLGGCTAGVIIFCYLGGLNYQNIFEVSTSVPNLTKIDQWIQKLLEKNRQTDDGPINLVIRLKKGFFSLAVTEDKASRSGKDRLPVRWSVTRASVLCSLRQSESVCMGDRSPIPTWSRHYPGTVTRGSSNEGFVEI